MFYGTMIGSVLIFFNVVSNYGEKNLKAPSLLGGSYPIESNNLPQCFAKNQVKLTIDQSGLYLFGKLTGYSQIGDKKKEIVIPLDGMLNQDHFSLTGKFKGQQDCSELANKTLKIEAEKKDKTIFGSLSWDNSQSKLTFMATLEPKKTEAGINH
ncbi:hypothetical protein AsFPU1_3266 [Aphanothece sacrum FPU1]|uniref:Uncharacterized protein n=2 Tax=Aphanothece sacrum TaxID=1122 RepID=A0A401IKS8_APHSA|nr:hypothetical protein AsFPU1_3266 [Aphanothece sacrum FPU1]